MTRNKHGFNGAPKPPQGGSGESDVAKQDPEEKPNFVFEEVVGDKKMIIKCEGEPAQDMDVMKKALELQSLFKNKCLVGDKYGE